MKNHQSPAFCSPKPPCYGPVHKCNTSYTGEYVAWGHNKGSNLVSPQKCNWENSFVVYNCNSLETGLVCDILYSWAHFAILENIFLSLQQPAGLTKCHKMWHKATPTRQQKHVSTFDVTHQRHTSGGFCLSDMKTKVKVQTILQGETHCSRVRYQLSPTMRYSCKTRSSLLSKACVTHLFNCCYYHNFMSIVTVLSVYM